MTQKEKVEIHLKAGNSITPIQALEWFGCFRLAAIVCNLREDLGMNIQTELVKNKYGTKYAKYSLIKKSLNGSILDELNPTGEWRQ